MARRKNSALNDLIGIASRLPWQVDAVLAVIASAVLHVIAEVSAQTTSAPNAAALGGIVVRQYVHVFAMLSQFIIPPALLIGAAVSFFKRKRSIELIDSVRGPSGRDVSTLTWQEFEGLIMEGFRQRGFRVAERGGAGADGGIDLALARGHERSLVQCKQWRAQQVGVAVVRELYGVMAAEHAAFGYVVTSGSFTKDATAFAAGRNIELIDGKKLPELLRDGQSTAARPIESLPAKPITMPEAPSCPRCRSPMVLRTAKRGSHAGRTFWGCPQYPKCQAIVTRE